MGLRERRARQAAIISRSSKSGSIATAEFDMAQPPPPPPSLLPPEVAVDGGNGGGWGDAGGEGDAGEGDAGGGDAGGGDMTVMASGVEVVCPPRPSVAIAVKVSDPDGGLVQPNE